ncbi:hypothetical protein QE392_003047 [Microbacterium proteolyticum]|nr:hypothetical protein [Microbacterium sp. SORGH_AS_0344]MDQ1171243.1 hypothetical protein [Microbacterium proteolyticum]
MRRFAGLGEARLPARLRAHPDMTERRHPDLLAARAAS